MSRFIIANIKKKWWDSSLSGYTLNNIFSWVLYPPSTGAFPVLSLHKKCAAWKYDFRITSTFNIVFMMTGFSSGRNQLCTKPCWNSWSYDLCRTTGSGKVGNNYVRRTDIHVSNLTPSELFAHLDFDERFVTLPWCCVRIHVFEWTCD